MPVFGVLCDRKWRFSIAIDVFFAVCDSAGYPPEILPAKFAIVQGTRRNYCQQKPDVLYFT